MIDLKLESQGIWIANLADEYAFKIELVGSPEIPMNQRSKLASRIARCVSAMAGIGDDNAVFFPGNSVRSVLVSNELKRLELEKQRDELLAALNSIIALENTEENEWDAVERVIPEMCAIARAATAKVEGGAQ